MSVAAISVEFEPRKQARVAVDSALTKCLGFHIMSCVLVARIIFTIRHAGGVLSQTHAKKSPHT